MKITRNVITISDLYEWLQEGTLIINNKYQRSGGLWPKNARSFFVDTVLNGFTFPKITIRQTIDLKTRKSVREVVDGQQRLTTIRDYINGLFALSNVSDKYRGAKFNDLEDDVQEGFLAYEVSVDTVVTGTTDEVLEIFRRMNSYTLPLNSPEKRHATYQGEFKWFILDLVKKYSRLFEKYEILTIREIARMQDADLLTELCQVVLEGITSRASSKLEKLYRENDDHFNNKTMVDHQLCLVMDFIKVNMDAVCTSEVMTNYMLYSLFSALHYNKFGIANIADNDVNNLPVIGEFIGNDVNIAIQNILELFAAVDSKNDTGIYGEFVRACSASTHTVSNRKIRLKWLVAALQNQF